MDTLECMRDWLWGPEVVPWLGSNAGCFLLRWGVIFRVLFAMRQNVFYIVYCFVANRYQTILFRYACFDLSPVGFLFLLQYPYLVLFHDSGASVAPPVVSRFWHLHSRILSSALAFTALLALFGISIVTTRARLRPLFSGGFCASLCSRGSTCVF